MACLAAGPVTALAIFVKTPGLSPIKTRLAAGIGEKDAGSFYALAIRAVEASARLAAADLVPCWAVAEAEAASHPLWSGFPTLAQGEGGLGDRLDHVYATLLARHGSVLMIGADSPQLTGADLQRAARSLDPFAMGRAEDGGFWLFGGAVPIAREIWQSVPYSTEHTADRLLAAIAPWGPTRFLPSLHDVDRAEDLQSLALALESLPEPTPEQNALALWLGARG